MCSIGRVFDKGSLLLQPQRIPAGFCCWMVLNFIKAENPYFSGGLFDRGKKPGYEGRGASRTNLIRMCWEIFVVQLAK
ncbi:MAG: hypothetical protein EAZ90_10570 [Oscillatoriales cyanobacterium]|uniref:hypothetical protein n=2 Tax=unclassified Microcoleus TaxID=2642155 RepID=UPI002600E8B6|nr:hypothetical protein [Microcoleus sp. PH2017_32_RDM_D_A]TAE43467.1 MAG: hypothetical protein EAZ90_10570 [Oscillatoriales cyanobacterium]